MNKIFALIFVGSFLLPITALAQYPGKPNCEAIKDPGKSLACMAQYADCSTPGWLDGVQRAECHAEDRAKQKGLADHRRKTLESVLNSAEKGKLSVADESFERFVRTQCAFEAAPVVGGSQYSHDFNNCVFYYREQRLNDYKRMHQNYSTFRNR